MSSTSAPWQFHWKHPQWEKADESISNSSSNQRDNSNQGQRRVLISHVAASVLPSEADHQQHNEDEHNNLVLTVSLLQESATQENNTADVVVLDLIYKETIIRSRTLRWPTITSLGHQQEQNERSLATRTTTTVDNLPCFPGVPWLQHNQQNALIVSAEDGDDDDLFPCFGPGGGLANNPLVSMLPRRRRQPQQQPPSTTTSRGGDGGIRRRESSRRQRRQRRKHQGLIAAALARLPRAGGDKSNSAVVADAQDVLNFLSLGQQQDHSQDTASQSAMAAIPPKTADGASDNNDDELPVEATELILACLSSDGKVFCYSPWTLLQTSSRRAEQKSTTPELETSMATFLFGASLLTKVQDDILPLSQPDQMIELSVPYLQKYQGDEEATLDMFGRPQQQQQQSQNRRSSVFDAAMWDPTLEQSTLPFQTKDNRPTHCVFCLDYLCVAGRGRQRWNYLQDGGFVSFLDLKSFSEKRTVFLPFVPQHISPFQWGPMKFLLVVGQTQVVAVRMDGSNLTGVYRGSSPHELEEENSDEELDGSERSNADKKKDFVPIHRFQIIPIDLPEYGPNSRIQAIGSEITTSPPAVAILSSLETGSVQFVQRTLLAFDRIESDGLFVDRDGKKVVITTQAGHVAQLHTVAEHPQDTIRCHLGQGWALLGGPSYRMHFLCLDGSNAERGAFAHDLTDGVFDDCVLSDVLPVDPFTLPKAEIPEIPSFNEERATVRNEGGVHERSKSEELDEIVLEAMESISRLTYRESLSKESPTSPRRKTSAFTVQEKSQRLLRKCSSWRHLDSSGAFESRFEAQVPVVSARGTSKGQFLLSQRAAAVECGAAAPFQLVLAWLSDQDDYFTAASVALDLLQDAESLRHLWRAFDKIDDEGERTKLEGLLDGVVPLPSARSKSIVANEKLQSTLTQLADMTVGCFIKGGFAMSSTLEEFLGKDLRYNPPRASLMLVASTASALSDDDKLVKSVMGKTYTKDSKHSENIQWPVRCLLKIGVSRDHLVTVLLLLNSTIPDELRRRDRNGIPSTTGPSLETCKSLVTLIVAASPESVEILLDLVDEKSRLRFWDSLDHDTRLELSLITVDEKYPLLRDQEVRAWALRELQRSIESVNSPSSKENVLLPQTWLCSVVLACLSNAGCDMDPLTTSSQQHEEKVDTYNDRPYRDEIQRVRRALTPALGSGGLDFGLVIPALLILEQRETHLCSTVTASTRSMLNASCYLAGRRTAEEPLFPLESRTLMRQCTIVGDVEAGANLIGGKNGLILECCHILVEELGMSMDEAENFLLSESMAADEKSSLSESLSFDEKETQSPPSDVFVVRSCHRRILWLLEEHVLNVRTYGEFETTQLRGKVDPVFAAKVCLRTWWKITRPQRLEDATRWLTAWLRVHLEISVDKTTISPHRLACAALIRALVWTENKNTKEIPLASHLRFDGLFLVQLSQACCGLVEALPSYALEESWKALDMASKRTALASSSQKNELQLEESFVSAAGSLGDLEV